MHIIYAHICTNFQPNSLLRPHFLEVHESLFERQTETQADRQAVIENVAQHAVMEGMALNLVPHVRLSINNPKQAQI